MTMLTGKTLKFCYYWKTEAIFSVLVANGSGSTKKGSKCPYSSQNGVVGVILRKNYYSGVFPTSFRAKH